MKQGLHFSGLNGIRAIAALAVVFSHATLSLGSFGLDSFLFGKYPDGNPRTTLLAGFGVSIFFSLSGFLITYLLLEEKEQSGINVKNFYLRRMLRIWPIYYLYIVLCFGTYFLFDIPFESAFIVFYLLLTANIPFIVGHTIPFLDHFWSLGVEEQFYSFWPWIVKKSAGLLRTVVLITIALIFIKCVMRIVVNFYDEATLVYDFLHVTRFHCMLIGAIGAILLFEKNEVFIKVMDNFLIQLTAWIVIVLIAINRFHIVSFLDNELVSIVTVFIIIGQIRIKYRIVNLDMIIFDFLGKISYGIYVFHPLIIFYLSKMMTPGDNVSDLYYLQTYFLIFASTILIAYLSYECFESRFLRLKKRYSTAEHG